MKTVEEAIEKVSAYHVAMDTQSIGSLLKMDLKGLTLKSFQEGEDSQFFKFLDPSLERRHDRR